MLWIQVYWNLAVPHLVLENKVKPELKMEHSVRVGTFYRKVIILFFL